MVSQNLQQLKLQTLKHFWGYDAFRPPQSEIIDRVLAGKDTIALLPTGAGKSLCYQLPALLLEGTCLVVSPLLALMKDQVVRLKNIGIEAEYLSSEMDDNTTEDILSRCKEALVKILYLAPERLTNQEFLRAVEETEISFIAVDEAHCISEWGQDFRPSYQHIRNFREQFVKAPIIALTATATPHVLREIQEKLRLKNPEKFQLSFHRSNIKIIEEEISDKYSYLCNLLQNLSGSGIIYTRTRRDAEELTGFLQKQGIGHIDYFHAGLSPKIKAEKQRNWQYSDHQILVSTNAFGMGIDKANVRFVVHFSAPASLENYYQEIGRAGRDGHPSHAILLWNKQEFNNFDDIFANSIPSKKEFSKIISSIYSSARIADGEKTDEIFPLNLQNLRQITGCSSAKIRNVLQFLHNQDLIFFNEMKSLSSLELKITPSQLDLLSAKDSWFAEGLLRNITGLSAGKVLFSEAKLAAKIAVQPPLLKERLRELHSSNLVNYLDGALSRIKFSQPRDDRSVQGKYWALFMQIQKNKLQKWEEMKFFIRDKNFCKMRMILTYFGEKSTENCGNCSVCDGNHLIYRDDLSRKILEILQKSPASVEQIYAQTGFRPKEKILENVIALLDAGKIKMKDFRTYSLA